MSAHTKGPWLLELVQTFPWGVKVTSADGDSVLEQSAYAHSSRQKTRLDNEIGFGFGKDREMAANAISKQDANARLIASAPDLLDFAREVADNAILAGMEIGERARELIAKATEVQP